MKQYKQRSLGALSLMSTLALTGACITGDVGDPSGELGDDDVPAVVDAALVGCPTGTNASAQARTVAAVALEIAYAYNNAYSWSEAGASISSQFYRPRAGGGIELQPTPGYPNNQDAAKAALAFAQQDASVAKYLLDGLNRCYAQTNGSKMMVVEGLDQAARMSAGGVPAGYLTGYCPNGTYQTAPYCYVETWADQAWCGQRAITVTRKYKNWSPTTPTVNGDRLGLVYTVEARTPFGNVDKNRAAYKGSSSLPCTPFDGPNGSNPYLIMAYDGAQRSFNDPSLYVGVDCRNKECIRELDVDPVAYMETGDSYNAQGLVGSQANPFGLVDTALYAATDHADEWATRVVNGVTERGQFSIPYTLFGRTKYKYIKR